MQLFTNNANTTLATGIGPGTLSLTVATGTGALFPSPSGGDFFKLTLYTLSGGMDVDIEIMTITARSGDTMTIGARAQEGTTAISHAAGKLIEMRDTAGWHNAVETALVARELTASKNAVGGYAGVGASYAIQVKNAGGTVTSLLSSAATAVRNYALPDASGTLALLSNITGTNSGTNTGDQTITLTGHINGTGTGSFVTTIQPNVVTFSMMAQVATATLLGRNSAGTGNVEALSTATVKSLLAINNVSNTSDAAKPVSTAQQAALDLKADKSNTYTKAEVDGMAAANQTGDVRTTARTLSVPDWLMSDGSAYLQTSYPDLFALLGTSFEPVKLSNPAVLPAGDANDVAYSGDGVYCAVAHANTPFITFYKRSGDVYTKLTNPAAVPNGEVNSVSFSADGIYLAACMSVSPYLVFYKRTGDNFARLTTPAVIPTSVANSVSLTPDGVYLAVGCQNAGGTSLMFYKRTVDTFAKLADPDIPLGGPNGRDVAFSPDGIHLAVAPNTSGAIVYKRTGDVFTKTTNAAFVSNNNDSVAYSPNGTYLTVGGSSPENLQLYKRSGDVYTKLTNPTVMPASPVVNISWSSDSSTIAIVESASTPYLMMYKRDSDIITRRSDPPEQPPAAAYGVAFSPDGANLAVAHNNPPYATFYARGYDPATQFVVPNYQPSGLKLRNYIKT